MNDKDFLIWVYLRLKSRGDGELLNFMHRFRCIIRSFPSDIITPNDGRGGNSFADLQEIMKKSDSTEEG